MDCPLTLTEEGAEILHFEARSRRSIIFAMPAIPALISHSTSLLSSLTEVFWESSLSFKLQVPFKINFLYLLRNKRKSYWHVEAYKIPIPNESKLQKIYLAEAADHFNFINFEKENILEGLDLLGLSGGNCLKKTLKKKIDPLNNLKHICK